MYYVYVLRSVKTVWTYIGTTDDLRKRLKEHNEGRVVSTKSRAPFKLVYYEAYRNKSDARRRERMLKQNSQQREMLYKNIESSLKEIVEKYVPVAQPG